MKADRTASLINFGLGGHGIAFACGNSTLSGYDNPERFQDQLNSGYYDDIAIPDGTPVLDKREILQGHPRLAIVSPLVGVKLTEPDYLDTTGSIVAQTVKSEPGNTFGSYVKVHEAHKKVSKEPGPLDKIPLADYIQWWESRGARVGQMINRRIVWR